ncbi:MAG: hypothetical protein JW894_02510 [Bacteroidales bacterium]|nr:hypothetical protein [Bacteroidales bacterium]
MKIPVQKFKTISKKYLSLFPKGLFYKQGLKKNIIVFASRRGGSTLLYELLSVDHRVRKIYEPFVLHPGHPATRIQLKYLPRKEHDIYIEVTPDEKEIIKNYLEGLLSGKYQEFKFYLSGQRTVIKIINALGLINLICQTHDVLPAYMIRHPISQSLSIIRNNWHLTTDAYLNSVVFREVLLNETQMQEAISISQKGTHFQKCILNWALDNYLPLKKSKTAIENLITYEELLINSSIILEFLAQKYQISNIDKMKKRLNHISSSSRNISTDQTKKLIEHNNIKMLISRWRDEVTERHCKQTNHILNLFEIDAYDAFNLVAAKKYLIYPELIRSL